MTGEYISIETARIMGEIEKENNVLQQSIGNKDKVINNLLQRIANLEYEVERLENAIDNANKYIDKMSYCNIVDNPKKDLQKILKKENK